MQEFTLKSETRGSMPFPDFAINKWNDEIKIHKTIATALKLSLKVRKYGKSFVYG